MSIFRDKELEGCIVMALIWLIDMERGNIDQTTKEKIAKEGSYIRGELEKEFNKLRD